ALAFRRESPGAVRARRERERGLADRRAVLQHAVLRGECRHGWRGIRRRAKHGQRGGGDEGGKSAKRMHGGGWIEAKRAACRATAERRPHAAIRFPPSPSRSGAASA